MKLKEDNSEREKCRLLIEKGMPNHAIAKNFLSNNLGLSNSMDFLNKLSF